MLQGSTGCGKNDTNIAQLTFDTQATAAVGMAETLGESLWFSVSVLPSKLHPSSWSPPSLQMKSYKINSHKQTKNQDKKDEKYRKFQKEADLK